MSVLADNEFRTILDDARARHAAVIGLIYATDSQAVALLRLYVTLGIATASGAAAGLGQSALVTRPAAWALAAGTAHLLIAAAFCLRALQSSRINLPGRDADFWQWAIGHDVERGAVLDGYLANLQTKGAENSLWNKRSANALKWAKRLGAAVPLTVSIVAVVAFFWNG